MADPKFEELTHTYTGKEYIFVGQPEASLREMECPICRQILSEPLQTSCGHLLCKSCHGGLQGDTRSPWHHLLTGGGTATLWGSQRIRRGVQCPVCRQEHTTGPDKFNERRVRNLQVRCTNYTEGCNWVGNLSDEEHHRKKQDGCQYEEIKCPHGCGDTMRRVKLSCHLNDCPMRPHNCEYCGEEGPYQYIVGDHLETCCKYPVECPNGCQENLPREEVLSQIKLKTDLNIMQGRLQAAEERVCELKTEVATKEQHIHALEADTRPLQVHQRDNKAKTARIRDLEEDARVTANQLRDLERGNKLKTDRIHKFEMDDTRKAGRQAGRQSELAAEKIRLSNEVSHMQEKLQLITTRDRRLVYIIILIAICIILLLKLIT